MTNTKQSSNQNSQKEANVKKFVVEAPEPKKGQTISSGGIRENGRIVSQYKNPKPYEDPILPPIINNHPAKTEFTSKKHSDFFTPEIKMYILRIVLQELGEPLLRPVLHNLAGKVVSIIDNFAKPKQEYMPKNEQEITDVKADKIQSACNNKIISFPPRQIV